MKIKPLFDYTNATDFLRQYLIACGVDENKYDLFLNPDDSCVESPWDYVNMDKAVDRLHQAIVNKEKVGIICDEDSDGYMSTAIAYRFLVSQGLEPIIFNHAFKAHGITVSQDENMVEQAIDSEINLLWVPDGGSQDAKQCHELKRYNIDVLITDHHPTTINTNPDAIVINPYIKGNTNLSGTAVTNLVAMGYCEKYNINKPDYSDFVALSTVSDSMNLTDCVNRKTLIDGFVNNSNINNFLQKLIETFGRGQEITPHMLSWNIIPKFNSIARSGDIKLKKMMIGALISSDKEIQDKAVVECRKAHNHQVNTVKKMMEEIEPNLDLNHKAIIGFTNSDNKEYIGLVAGKIASKYGKPCFLLREKSPTMWTGSFRSKIPLVDIIKNCGIYGVGSAGQPMAAGVWMPKSSLNKFIDFLDTLSLEVEPEIDVACEIKPENIVVKLCRDIESNELMWGQGLPKPVFYIKTNVNPSAIQIFRKKTNTVKLTLNGIDFMLFRASEDDIERLTSMSEYEIEMLVELATNEWNNVVSSQGIIQKFEVNEITHNENWQELF